MYFLSLLCGLWSGSSSMEIGDFIWQFLYFSPPPPPFHTLTLILTTPSLYKHKNKYIPYFPTDAVFYLELARSLRSSHRSISLPNFFTFHITLQFPFERSRNLGVIFSFLPSILRWLWQDTNVKTHQIQTRSQQLWWTDTIFTFTHI